MAKYEVDNRIVGREHGSGVYTHSPYLEIEFEEMLQLKNLKSERMQSGYVDTVMVWKEDDNKIKTEHLATLIHFFTKLVVIPDDFIERYNVKPYHISLIRRMYIEHDWQDSMACMGFKRPYGNSDVLGDVQEEYESVMGPITKFEDIPESFYEGWLEDGEEMDNDTKSDIISEYSYEHREDGFLLNIHNEVMDILEIMLNELELKSLIWESDNTPGGSNWNPVWTPTEAGINKYQTMKREVKLERILKDD